MTFSFKREISLQHTNVKANKHFVLIYIKNCLEAKKVYLITYYLVLATQNTL